MKQKLYTTGQLIFLCGILLLVATNYIDEQPLALYLSGTSLIMIIVGGVIFNLMFFKIGLKYTKLRALLTALTLSAFILAASMLILDHDSYWDYVSDYDPIVFDEMDVGVLREDINSTRSYLSIYFKSDGSYNLYIDNASIGFNPYVIDEACYWQIYGRLNDTQRQRIANNQSYFTVENADTGEAQSKMLTFEERAVAPFPLWMSLVWMILSGIGFYLFISLLYHAVKRGPHIIPGGELDDKKETEEDHDPR